MGIYVVHSKSIDYINEIYKPIRNSEYLKQFDIVFPHEKDSNSYNDRSFYKDFDLVIAEVSEPGTGIGIELGWFYDDNVPIYCISKEGKKVSKSLHSITSNFYTYEDNILELIEDIIRRFYESNRS